MKRFWTLFFFALLTGCAAAPTSRTVTLIPETGAPQRLTTTATTPAKALAEGGYALPPDAVLLLDGHPVDANAPWDCLRCTLQIRAPQEVTMNERRFESAAFTLAEALSAQDIMPTFGDRLSLPPTISLSAPRRVAWTEGVRIQVQTAAGTYTLTAQADTVAEALSLAGISVQGLDETQPPLDAPLPADGLIQIRRIREEILLAPKALPFETVRQPLDTLELDQEAVLQSGEYGLSLQRTRIRLEDEQETARIVEEETLIRPPQEQIIGYGTRVAIHSLDTPYGTLQYWRAISMYATSYSPCRSSADRCYYQTASGKSVQHGVVAMIRSWYLALRGQPVYIPGYGLATVEDVGAGFPDGRPWIDLGYSDEDYQPWSSWVTVYFLTPVPPEIPWMLR